MSGWGNAPLSPERLSAEALTRVFRLVTRRGQSLAPSGAASELSVDDELVTRALPLPLPPLLPCSSSSYCIGNNKVLQAWS